MDIKVIKIKQFNSTYKRVLMIDNNPICIVKGDKKASECIRYINGYNADINDGKIKKLLDKYRTPMNQDSEMKKKTQKHKVIHKFN